MDTAYTSQQVLDKTFVAQAESIINTALQENYRKTRVAFKIQSKLDIAPQHYRSCF